MNFKNGDRIRITYSRSKNLIGKTGTFIDIIKKGGLLVEGCASIKLDDPPKGYPSCLDGIAIIDPEFLEKEK